MEIHDIVGSASEKIRQQFESHPYPNVSIEELPSWDVNSLYIHNLVTSRYLRNQTVINTQGRCILEAGCGSGYGALVLALTNPGARIVGVDLSQNSIELAKARLNHHGFHNCEFHVMKLEDLPQLQMRFDYINCDEVLYLLPDPTAGLRAMKSVLKPDGIIRTNLHSRLQRERVYQAQDVFRLLGLLSGNPSTAETAAVRDVMESLYDSAGMKQTWHTEMAADDQWILSNYLIHGDRGYTIPELFYFLQEADLEFISMVDWQTWRLRGLFKKSPELLVEKLKELSISERLHLFELIQPVHRLLDFWCGHADESENVSPENWTEEDWKKTIVHLHPQLRTEARRLELQHHIRNQESFQINDLLTDFDPVWIESTIGACLLPLWEEPQPFPLLLELWLKIRPLNPITLEPASSCEVFESVRKTLVDLESSGPVMLERRPLAKPDGSIATFPAVRDQ